MTNHPRHAEPTYVYNGVIASIWYVSGTATPSLHNDIWHSGHVDTVAACLKLIETECARRGAAGLPRRMARGEWSDGVGHTWSETDYVPSPNGMIAVCIHQAVNDPRTKGEFEVGVDGVTAVTTDSDK